MTPEIKAVLIAAAIAFVLFRVYRRVRGSVGRQPLQKSWLALRTLSLLLVGAAALALSSPGAVQWLAAAGGAIIGAGIAAYALSHTRIEHTDRGWFYSGHPYIGLGIIGLFLARILFNLATVYSEVHNAAVQDRQAIVAHMASSPFTLGTLMLLAGYYVIYSLGVLRLSARGALV